MTGTSVDTTSRLAAIATDAGVTAWVHAERLDGPAGSVSLMSDEPVAVASLYKLPLAIVWADMVTAGELEPRERVTLRRSERVEGPTGVSMLLDDAELSQRDAIRFMLALSDNTCADAVLQRVGLRRVAEWLEGAGLGRSAIRHGAAESLRILLRDTGTSDAGHAGAALAEVDREVDTSEYHAALASSSTAADLCGMLAILWRGVGPAYDVVRDALAHQAWRHRIGSGFPHDDVVVQGKTGTLARLRHEAAVVTFPGEHPVAVAILTRAARAERHLPRVDAAIGELARTAVTPLRLPT